MRQIEQERGNALICVEQAERCHPAMLIAQCCAHAVIQKAGDGGVFCSESLDCLEWNLDNRAQIKRDYGGAVRAAIDSFHAQNVARHRKAKYLFAAILLYKHAFGSA